MIGQGDAFRMLFEYDKAIDCYTQAIERSPSSLSTALLKRAIVLIEIKRLDEALKDLEKTIQMVSLSLIHTQSLTPLTNTKAFRPS
ncbi:MAG: tetratricopeptide repeat protein [Sphingobacteriales bacterium]|nr:MAG: tetratricopeptide repeat protein [Sphingobacteriales bacterium]